MCAMIATYDSICEFLVALFMFQSPIRILNYTAHHGNTGMPKSFMPK